MHRFQRRAPLDVTPYPEPPVADRTGPPLTRGFLFTLVGTVAADECSPEVLAALSSIDPDAWYHGQLLETILDEFEARDPSLPHFLGRNVYFMFRRQLESLGIQSATAVLESLPRLWMEATRGDGGEWRSAMVGPKRARLEAEQPYNCLFEQGAIVGFIESYDAADVRIEHTQCMRKGAPFCVMEVTWQE